MGSEYYVTMMSFVDKTQIEPGCTVLMNHKVYPNLTKQFDPITKKAETNSAFFSSYGLLTICAPPVIM